MTSCSQTPMRTMPMTPSGRAGGGANLGGHLAEAGTTTCDPATVRPALNTEASSAEQATPNGRSGTSPGWIRDRSRSRRPAPIAESERLRSQVSAARDPLRIAFSPRAAVGASLTSADSRARGG